MDTIASLDPTGVLSAANAAIKLVGTAVKVAPTVKAAVDRARNNSVSNAQGGTAIPGASATAHAQRDVTGRTIATTVEVEPISDDQERRAYEKVNMVLKTMGERILKSGLVDVQALARALMAATAHIEVRLFSIDTNKLFHSLASKLNDPVLVNSVFTSIYFIGFLTAELTASLPNYKDTYYPLGQRIIQQMFKVALGLDGFKENLNANLEAYKTLAVTAGLLRPTDIEYSIFRNFPSFSPCKYSGKGFTERMYYKDKYSQLVKHLETYGFPQPLQGRDVGVIRDWRFLSGDSNSRQYEVEKADKHIGENFGRVLYWLICSACRMPAGHAVIAYFDQHIQLIKWLGPRFGYRVINAAGDLNFTGQHLSMSKKCKAIFDTWVIIMPSVSALAARRQSAMQSSTPLVDSPAYIDPTTRQERGAHASRPILSPMSSGNSGSHTGGSLSGTTIAEEQEKQEQAQAQAVAAASAENQSTFFDPESVAAVVAGEAASTLAATNEGEEPASNGSDEAGTAEEASKPLDQPAESPLPASSHVSALEGKAAAMSQQQATQNRRHSNTPSRLTGGPPSRPSSASSTPSLSGPNRQSSIHSIKRKPTIQEGVDLTSIGGSTDTLPYMYTAEPEQSGALPAELPAPIILAQAQMPAHPYMRQHLGQLQQVLEVDPQPNYTNIPGYPHTHIPFPGELPAGVVVPPNQAPPSVYPMSPVSSPSEIDSTPSSAAPSLRPVVSPPPVTSSARPRRQAPKRPRTVLAAALFDFEADETNPEEFSFKAGDILEIIEKNKVLEEDGWCRARLKGQKKIGLAPFDYLEEMPGQQSAAPASATAPNVSASNVPQTPLPQPRQADQPRTVDPRAYASASMSVKATGLALHSSGSTGGRGPFSKKASDMGGGHTASGHSEGSAGGHRPRLDDIIAQQQQEKARNLEVDEIVALAMVHEPSLVNSAGRLPSHFTWPHYRAPTAASKAHDVHSNPDKTARGAVKPGGEMNQAVSYQAGPVPTHYAAPTASSAAHAIHPGQETSPANQANFHDGKHHNPVSGHYAAPTESSAAHVSHVYTGPAQPGAVPHNQAQPHINPTHPGQIQPNLYQQIPQNTLPYNYANNATGQPVSVGLGAFQGATQDGSTINQTYLNPASQFPGPKLQNHHSGVNAQMVSSVAPAVASLGVAAMQMHAHSHASPHHHAMTNNHQHQASNNSLNNTYQQQQAMNAAPYNNQPQATYNAAPPVANNYGSPYYPTQTYGSGQQPPTAGPSVGSYNAGGNSFSSNNNYDNSSAYQANLDNSSNFNSVDLSGANLSLFGGSNSPSISATGDDSNNVNNNNSMTDLSALSLVDTGTSTASAGAGSAIGTPDAGVASAPVSTPTSPIASLSNADFASTSFSDNASNMTSPLAALAPAGNGGGATTTDTSSYFQSTDTTTTTTDTGSDNDMSALGLGVSPLAVLAPGNSDTTTTTTTTDTTTTDYTATGDSASINGDQQSFSYDQQSTSYQQVSDSMSVGSAGDGDGGSTFQSYVEDDFSDAASF